LRGRRDGGSIVRGNPARQSGERATVKAPKFSYVRAEGVEQVLALLAEHGEDARILAGGQSLMPTLNMRLSSPKLVIDINRLAGLAGISIDGGTVRIGALARHAEVMSSGIVAKHLPLIAAAMPHVAHVAIRNRGTFGGSIALADPAAELPACLLALGGRVVLESTRGRRELSAESYFLGLYQTERQPDELLTEVLIPAESPGVYSAFRELSRRHGDFAMAGVAALARVAGDKLSDVRLVHFGSEVRPTLARKAMTAAMVGPWGDATRDAVLAALGHDLDPIDNIYGKPATKLHLQRVLTRRALDDIATRAKAA
jgi:carbon-monoxide dehydrogenase medium subunit